MNIQTLDTYLFQEYKEQIFAIFLSQSSYTNLTYSEQLEKFDKWVTWYQKKWPNWFFIAVTENKEVLGYLCGCPDSLSAKDEIAFKSFHLFSDLYKNYPFHCHMNVKQGVTGQGVGSKLLIFVKAKLQTEGFTSIHIITASNEKNVSFYQKNQFEILQMRSLNQYQLLFMVCRLFPEKEMAAI